MLLSSHQRSVNSEALIACALLISCVLVPLLPGAVPLDDGFPDRRPHLCDRRTADKAPKPLLVEPDVFHAPAVVDAVDHDREPLDIGLLTGRAARIEDDRSCRILRQLPFDLPYQLLALF